MQRLLDDTEHLGSLNPGWFVSIKWLAIWGGYILVHLWHILGCL